MKWKFIEKIILVVFDVYVLVYLCCFVWLVVVWWFGWWFILLFCGGGSVLVGCFVVYFICFFYCIFFLLLFFCLLVFFYFFPKIVFRSRILFCGLSSIRRIGIACLLVCSIFLGLLSCMYCSSFTFCSGYSRQLKWLWCLYIPPKLNPYCLQICSACFVCYVCFD